MSKEGITLDSLKFQAIKELPPPCTLCQLQSLQGKANFLRRFIPNYATTMHGFLRLLRSNIPFIWDDYAEQAFDALKHALSSAPLISPPEFEKDFILYISTSAYLVEGILI